MRVADAVTARQMCILWVKLGTLWPPHTGGRLRSFHVISELSRRHRVIVLTTCGPGDDPEEQRRRLPRCEHVETVPYSIPKYGSPRFALALLRSWLSPLPVDVIKFRVPALSRRVRQILASQQVDVCVADFLSAVPNIPLGGPAPVILFARNVEHMIWKRLSQNETRSWRRALLGIEWRKMQRYEAWASAHATMTVTVSDADGALLAATAPGARVCTTPTGVDLCYYSPDGASETSTQLVFVGSMDWYPNEDAVLYFIDAILPAIRRDIPEVGLSVVGRNPTPRLRRAAAEAGIRVTGTVEDIRPYIAEAAVYVVPLRIGSGVRLKIFEALAMGKAVVSTRVGAEGLPLVAGTHILSADAPAEFARAVVSLLRDPGRRRTLGMAGRRLVEGFSWSLVARDFEGRCREVRAAGGGPDQGTREGSVCPCV